MNRLRFSLLTQHQICCTLKTESKKGIKGNPKAGDAIQGTGGIRKIRIPLDQHGKRGGGRVIYVDIELKETIYFINVYAKNEKDDLTEDERKAFKAVVKILKEK